MSIILNQGCSTGVLAPPWEPWRSSPEVTSKGLY